MNKIALSILILIGFQGFTQGMLKKAQPIPDPRNRSSKDSPAQGTRTLDRLDKEEIQELVQYLDGQAARTRALEQTNQDLSRQNQELDQQVGESDNSLMAVTGQLKTAQVAFDEAKATNAAQKRELDAELAKNAELNRQIKNAATAKNTKQQQELADASAQNAALIAEITTLKAGSKNIAEKISAMNKDLSTVVKEARSSSVATSAPIDQLKNKVGILKTAYTTAQESQATTEILNTALKTQNAALTKTNQQLSEQEEAAQLNRAALEKKNDEITSLETNNQTLIDKNNALGLTNTQLNTAIATAQKAAQTAMQDKQRLQELEDKLTALNTQCTQQEGSYTTEIKNKAKEIEQLKLKIRDAELCSANAGAHELAMKSMEAEKDKEIVRLNKQLQTQATSITTTAGQKAEWEQETTKLKQALSAADNKFKEIINVLQ